VNRQAQDTAPARTVAANEDVVADMLTILRWPCSLRGEPDQ